MKIEEVFAKQDELIGQTVKIEGTLIREKGLSSKPWYIVPSNTPLDILPEHLIHIDSTVPDSKDSSVITQYKVLGMEPPILGERNLIEAFVSKFLDPDFSAMTEEQVKELWEQLHWDGTLEALEAFEKFGIYDDLVNALTIKFDKRVWRSVELRLRASSSFKPASIVNNYLVYHGYVIGRLQDGDENPAKLKLTNLQELAIQHKNFTSYSYRHPDDLSEMKMQVGDITPALSVVKNPYKFTEKIIRLSGIIVRMKGVQSHFIIPDRIHLKLKQPQQRGILIASQNICNMLEQNLSTVYGSFETFFQLADLHIIGRIVPSERDPFFAAITDISEILVNDHSFKHFKL